MKKFLKYCLFVLPALALVFIIVISCDKDNLTKNKDVEPVFLTYSGWDTSTSYTYRIAHPDYFGDSSFMLVIYYNGQDDIVDVDLSVVAAEQGDEIKSYLFVDYPVFSNNDEIGFTIPEGDKVWFVDLINSQINGSGGSGGNVKLTCSCCPQEGSQSCEPTWTHDDNNNRVQKCLPHGYYGCEGACRTNVDCDGNPVATGPSIIIQADKLRINGNLYQ